MISETVMLKRRKIFFFFCKPQASLAKYGFKMYFRPWQTLAVPAKVKNGFKLFCRPCSNSFV
jgi:hypothetical protein